MKTLDEWQTQGPIRQTGRPAKPMARAPQLREGQGRSFNSKTMWNYGMWTPLLQTLDTPPLAFSRLYSTQYIRLLYPFFIRKHRRGPKITWKGISMNFSLGTGDIPVTTVKIIKIRNVLAQGQSERSYILPGTGHQNWGLSLKIWVIWLPFSRIM